MNESKIHSTAMVEKGAKLGEGCVVGPGAIVGAEVELGAGCVVGPRAVLDGRIKMGAKNKIGVGAVIGGEPQDAAYAGAKSGVEVGEGNVFREYVTVHRGTKEGSSTVIGSGCFLMVGAHVAHNCRLGDGNDEREQTLNQLLVEMDGFEGNEGIIVIAATNRPDVLDKALLRPGRFDRQVTVGLPDVRGREQILNVHIKKVPIADDVEVKYIAQGTPGFSGADLANLINEGALFAARMNKRVVNMSDLEKAKDKLIMGAERHTMVMDEKEKRMTAYHEAGHAIVGKLVPEHDPVYKVSIMPRGRALGVTMFLPERDQYSASKQKLDSMISSLYGGRIAEEVVFGWEQVSTGASNDIERATELARNMVTKWGLSQRLGPLSYSEEEGEVFLGRSVTQHKTVAEETSHTIDEEIRSFIDRNYERAERLLKENIDILHSMAAALMKYETIDKFQIDDLMARMPVRDPQGWDDKPPRGDLNTDEVKGKDDKKNDKTIGQTAEQG